MWIPCWIGTFPENSPNFIKQLWCCRLSTICSLGSEIWCQEEKYMSMKPNLPNFPIVQGHRAQRKIPVMGGWERSIGEITDCLEEDLYLESQLISRHKFVRREIKAFPCQLPACCLRSCWCQPPQTDSRSLSEATCERENARLARLKLKSRAKPESCHLSKGIAT